MKIGFIYVHIHKDPYMKVLNLIYVARYNNIISKIGIHLGYITEYSTN